MLKHKGLLSVLLVIVFLATTGCMLFFSFSDTVLASGTIIPLPTYLIPPVSLPPIMTLPPDHLPLTQWNEISNDSGLGSFHSIGGIAVSNSNILAVGNAVSTDRYIQYYDGGTWSFSRVDFVPNYLEWGSNEVLYAAYTGSGRVYKSSNPMSENPTWKNISVDSDIMYPSGMAIDYFYNLLVVDRGPNVIRRYDGSGWTVLTSPADAAALVDIASVGTTLYVTDEIMNCIYKKLSYSPTWTKITNSTYINSPNSITSDSEGNLFFVSDIKVGTVYKRSIVKYDGTNFSIFVPSGTNVGQISDGFSGYQNEEIAIGLHDKLFYGDNGYTRVIKEQCDDSSINLISVNGEYLQMTSGQTTFNRSVEADSETAEINLFPTCAYASWGGEYYNSLNFGLNTFVVSCIAENGSRTDYTVNITRELSDNALLTEITIDSVPISGFVPNIFAYTGINVPFSTTSAEISALSQDANASVTGTGTIPLNVGENPMLMLVMAQDGITVQQYILTINREADVPSATPSPSPTPGTSPTPTPTQSPTTTSAPTATPGTTATPAPTQNPTTTPAPSATPEATENPVITPATSPTSAPAPTQSPAVTPTPAAEPDTSDDTSSPNPLMPVIYVLAGIILLGGGVFAGIMFGKKKK